MAAEKARLRTQFRAVRAALAPEARAAAGAAICAHLLALVRERGARTVSAFWPLAGEVDLRPFVREMSASGVVVALPVVVSARGEAPRLEHRRFESEGALARGRFGVMEPLASAPRVAPEAIDLAVVPALAADAGGVRLGYGGGFYDAFLAETGALRVGALFASGVADALPAEPHDERLDAVVTERGVLWTSRQSRQS